MSYIRVIPRDLFNESNLLKCLGRIYINLEAANLSRVELEHDGQAFDIDQDDSDGSLYVRNVKLLAKGRRYTLRRPLNSREPWPLYLETEEEEEIDVFSDDGEFSPDFVAWLAA